ncbi:hypothetical protein A4U55_08275 [Moraxella catarrhalis]|nr:hypothetical protein A4U55_08275 [Moraxella catarrhalis]
MISPAEILSLIISQVSSETFLSNLPDLVASLLFSTASLASLAPVHRIGYIAISCCVSCGYCGNVNDISNGFFLVLGEIFWIFGIK